MLQCLVLHHSHDGGNTQSVVSTQCCSLCPYPATVNPWMYRIGFKIVVGLGVTLGNHVHMSLQDDTLVVFHSW